MRQFLPVATLGLLVAAGMAGGLALGGDQGPPGLSSRMLADLHQQGVVFELDNDQPRADEDLLARLVVAAHPDGDKDAQEVLAVSHGIFTYQFLGDTSVRREAWAIVFSNVEAKCFGGDLCPDPPSVGTEVWFVLDDPFGRVAAYWLGSLDPH